MAGLQEHAEALAAEGVRIVTASADPLDKALEVAATITLPIAYGVTREQSDRVGAWWGEARKNMQPAEFLLGSGGRVQHSLYASGPVGRMNPAELLRQVTNLNKAARKSEA